MKKCSIIFPGNILLKVFLSLFFAGVAGLSSAAPLLLADTIYVTSGASALLCNTYDTDPTYPAIKRSNCRNVVLDSSATFKQPAGIALSTYYGYVADLANPNGITTCRVAFSDSGNGLYSCKPNQVEGLNNPINITPYPKPDGSTPNFVYILNQSKEDFSKQQISVCAVNSTNGFLSNCSYTASGNWLEGPLAGITFAPMVNSTTPSYAYVSVGSVTKQCLIDQTNGSLSNCKTTDSDNIGLRGGISAAWTVRHEAAPTVTAIQDSNGYGELAFSTLNPQNGSLNFNESKLIIDKNGLPASQPGSIALTVMHPLNEYPRTYVYLADSSGTLWTCQIEEPGLIFDCTHSDLGSFPNTIGVVTRVVYP